MSDYKCFCPDGSHLLDDEKTCSVGKTHSVYAASCHVFNFLFVLHLGVERCNDSYCNYNGHCVKEGNRNKCL